MPRTAPPALQNDDVTTQADSRRRTIRIRLLVVSVGVLIALAELDRLVGQILASNGQAFSLTESIGVGAFGAVPAWAGWASATTSPAGLIFVHVLLDVVLIACYLFLLWPVSTETVWRAVLWCLVGADVLEDVFLAIQAWLLTSHQYAPALSYIGAAASLAKWLAAAVLVVWLFRRRQQIWDSVVAATKLVAIHRSGFIVVGILAAVSLVPQTGVLEQLPDLQRAWIRWGFSYDRPALNDSVAAELDGIAIFVSLGFTVLVWMALFVIGRVRTRVAYSNPAIRPYPKLGTHVLALIPAMIGAIVFVALLIYGGATTDDPWAFVDAPVFFIFLGVATLIPVVSYAIVCKRAGTTDKSKKDPGSLHTTSPAVLALGDAIAWASIAVAGLGVVRSFTALALLGLPGLDSSTAGARSVVAGTSLMLVLGGLSTAVFAPEIGRTILECIRGIVAWLPKRASAAVREAVSPTSGDPVGWLRWVAIGAAGASLIALSVWPLAAASVLGALGTVLIVLMSWAALLTVAESRLQEERPLELFRLVGFRSAPLVTLFLTLPFVVSQIAPVATVHAIQDDAGYRHPLFGGSYSVYDDPGRRPTLLNAFRQWSRSPACNVETPGGSYRPLILVAAQGGGIRAATWTVDIMREFLESDCSKNAVLLSSGASGGSVGLSLFEGLGDAVKGFTARQLADQKALSAGLIGTLVTDPVASTTGLRTPSQGGYLSPDLNWTWQDRAALIQAAWINNFVPFVNRYDFERSGAVGYLVLNSTAAGTGCRALVSQVDLGIGASFTDDGTDTPKAACNANAPGVSSMIDIQDYCHLASDWATAAMLSARFPVVTPAARLAGLSDDSKKCRAVAEMQFVDGGYAENSGLGTLSDISPELVRIIADANAVRGDAAPIVPFVLYIRNETGADVAAARVPPTSELLVPFLALGTKEALTSDQAWLERLSDTLERVCASNDLRCRAAVRWAREDVPDGIAVAAPSTHPAIVAPLGWTLSTISDRQLWEEAYIQKRPTCDGARGDRYGRFGDLMAIMGLQNRGCEV